MSIASQIRSLSHSQKLRLSQSKKRSLLNLSLRPNPNLRLTKRQMTKKLKLKLKPNLLLQRLQRPRPLELLKGRPIRRPPPP